MAWNRPLFDPTHVFAPQPEPAGVLEYDPYANAMPLWEFESDSTPFLPIAPQTPDWPFGPPPEMLNLSPNTGLTPLSDPWRMPGFFAPVFTGADRALPVHVPQIASDWGDVAANQRRYISNLDTNAAAPGLLEGMSPKPSADETFLALAGTPDFSDMTGRAHHMPQDQASSDIAVSHQVGDDFVMAPELRPRRPSPDELMDMPAEFYFSPTDVSDEQVRVLEDLLQRPDVEERHKKLIRDYLEDRKNQRDRLLGPDEWMDNCGRFHHGPRQQRLFDCPGLKVF